ncbi:BTAD domain-containing putative transcriptional regulator [Streptomyces sp. NPDC020800]|uniref:AfsR/SARP family transcriptional regulator n=1 Tax=Streptomyces sp. NPDC020800 TaxID=3365092 RepID=UPI00379F3579
MLRFSILGALQILTTAGPADISGDLQRTLVQTLLVSEGQPVSGEGLAEEMWGDAAPDHQANALQAHVSRLRRRLRELEPDRPASRLTIHPSGYRLSVGEGELDAAEFIRAVRLAESAGPDDAPHTAGLLREALAMWRGPVFGGFAAGTLCQLAGARYEEHRMRAMELRFDAELRLGRHAAVLAELAEAHTNHPLRERFCEQLMIALYGSGRQADALDVFRRMRRHLDDELGIQPSPALRRVENAILSHDPALTGDLRLQPV